jgi:hypothetical protein
MTEFRRQSHDDAGIDAGIIAAIDAGIDAGTIAGTMAGTRRWDMSKAGHGFPGNATDIAGVCLAHRLFGPITAQSSKM